MTTRVVTRPNKTGWVHPYVRAVAIELAEAMYEQLAGRGTAESNLWFQQNKNRPRYVNNTWPTLLPLARKALAKLLTQPNITVTQKNEIATALIEDNELREGRERAHAHRVGRLARGMRAP